MTERAIRKLPWFAAQRGEMKTPKEKEKKTGRIA